MTMLISVLGVISVILSISALTLAAVNAVKEARHHQRKG